MLKLPLAGCDNTPAAAILFGVGVTSPQPFTLDALGLFFELSMGLSARKEIPGMSWYLRMNPSSGNLHPTEAYAVLPAREWLPGGAGVFHYAPLAHALEQRARQSPGASQMAGFYVGLTSITWREAWKYGERAFRYCQHDVGHALATLRYAAAVLGWRAELLPKWDDAQLARLLGLDRRGRFCRCRTRNSGTARQGEGERNSGAGPVTRSRCTGRMVRTCQPVEPFPFEWPVIDEAIAVSERKAPMADQCVGSIIWPPPASPACAHSSGQLIRQRRSAVDFDGVTCITREKFLAILDTTLPRASAPPFDAWPFPPRLHLVLFVHRVMGLEPGMYLWLRAPADEDTLRHAFRDIPDWEARRTWPLRCRSGGWDGGTCAILRGPCPANRTLPPMVRSASACWRGSSRSCGNAARRLGVSCSGSRE